MNTKKTTKKPIKKSPAKAPVKAAKSAAPSTSQRIDGLEKLVAILKADLLEYRTKQDTNAVVASTSFSRVNAVLEGHQKTLAGLNEAIAKHVENTTELLKKTHGLSVTVSAAAALAVGALGLYVLFS